VLRFRSISLFMAGLCVSSVTAFAATVVFTDGTFNLSNYSTTAVFKSAASISLDQCISCGNPGNALQIIGTWVTGTGIFDVGFVNKTFSYDPKAQGAVATISASVDKNVISSVSLLTASVFHPLIEQDGIYYLAAVTGPPVLAAYNTISQSGLVATDFVEFNFATGTLGTANPNFDGDTMLFGLGHIGGARGLPAGPTFEADYDNLRLAVAMTVPEPSTLLLFATALAGVLFISRSKLAKQE